MIRANSTDVGSSASRATESSACSMLWPARRLPGHDLHRVVQLVRERAPPRPVFMPETDLGDKRHRIASSSASQQTGRAARAPPLRRPAWQRAGSRMKSCSRIFTPARSSTATVSAGAASLAETCRCSVVDAASARVSWLRGRAAAAGGAPGSEAAPAPGRATRYTAMSTASAQATPVRCRSAIPGTLVTGQLPRRWRGEDLRRE